MTVRKLHALLSRETSSGRFIAEIDGLRLVAILSVVVFHISAYLTARSTVTFARPVEHEWLAQLAACGKHGVELFFVISGFILGLPFAAHHLKQARPVNLKSYFLRRVTRLEPPYIVALLLFFALTVVLNGERPALLMPHLAAGLGYLHNLVFQDHNTILGVAWSLEIEIQFYLLVPWLSRLFAVRSKRARRVAILAVCAVAALFQIVCIPPGMNWMSLSILCYLQYFLVGFLLADIYLTDWSEAPTRHWAWDLYSLVGWPLLYVVLRMGFLEELLFPALVLGLYAAVFRSVVTNRVLTNPCITAVGGMCYSIYLLHYHVISLVGRFSLGLHLTDQYAVNLLLQLLLLCPALLVVCSLYFLAVEKPCMRRDWPARLATRIRGTKAAARPRGERSPLGAGWTEAPVAVGVADFAEK